MIKESLNYIEYIQKNSAIKRGWEIPEVFFAESFINDLMDTGNFGFLIVKEGSHEILFATKNSENIFGFLSEDLIGKTLIESVYQNIHPDDAEYLNSNFSELWKIINYGSREELVQTRMTAIFRFKKPNGTEIKLMNQNKFLTFDSSGRPVYTLIIFSDVSLFSSDIVPLFNVSKIIPTSNPVIKKFTSREKEIIRFITRGSNIKSIASKLFISEQTVKNHRGSIFKKANVNNMVELTTFAIQNGIF